MIVQDSNEITVVVGVVRLELERDAVRRDSLLDLAALHETVAEMGVGLGIVRLQSYGFLIAGERLLRRARSRAEAVSRTAASWVRQHENESSRHRSRGNAVGRVDVSDR